MKTIVLSLLLGASAITGGAAVADGVVRPTQAKVRTEVENARDPVLASGTADKAFKDRGLKFIAKLIESDKKAARPIVKKLRKQECFKSGCVASVWLDSSDSAVFMSRVMNAVMDQWQGQQYWSPVQEESGRSYIEFVIYDSK